MVLLYLLRVKPAAFTTMHYQLKNYIVSISSLLVFTMNPRKTASVNWREAARQKRDAEVTSENKIPDYSGNKLTCNKGYRIDSSELLLNSEIICSNGRWTLASTNQQITKNSCVAHCSTECKQGGRCIEPETCECPKEFTGKFCQEKTCFSTSEEIVK